MTAASNPSISDPKTETEPRSCRVIFTCVKMKIATLPLVYKGATLFTPKKLGNLQVRNSGQSPLQNNSGEATLRRVVSPRRRSAFAERTYLGQYAATGQPSHLGRMGPQRVWPKDTICEFHVFQYLTGRILRSAISVSSGVFVFTSCHLLQMR